MYRHTAHRTLEIIGIQVKQLLYHQLLHQSLASSPSDCLSTTTIHSLKHLQASQTQSIHSPVLQATHITNTVHSLPNMTGDTDHKHSPLNPQYDRWHRLQTQSTHSPVHRWHRSHSPLTPQYDRWHTSQTQSTHSPVWQVTQITNPVHSLPSMSDTSGRSHMCHNIWNAHAWKQH
jgi:hypothetical protein